jgi:hypothetical protein
MYIGSMPKWMITIVWNPTGFHVIQVLPSRYKCNSSYYQNEILGPLSEWQSEQAGAASRRLIVHADNPRPHIHIAAAATSQKFMDENAMIKASHPPDSPDLAPSDFSLFSYVKHPVQFPDQTS